MGQHLDNAFRTLGVRSVAEVTAEVNRLKAALVAIKAADAFGPDVNRAAAAMQARIQALDAELGHVPATAAKAQAGLHGVAAASTSASQTMEAATSKAISMGAALLGIASAGQAVTGVISSAAAFETLRVKLEQLLGSSDAAAVAFERIKKLAIETPFEVKDLTDSYIRLTAFGLKPTENQLMALADTAALAGGGTEALSRVTLALGQAWAKTKLQGDEILQLTEAGVPVWDLLAKATGKNVTELRHLSEAGALGRDVILKLFDAMGEKNAGASARLMATFSGAVSNAKDAMAEFFDLIGRSGALEYLTKKLQGALAEFDRMKDSGELERKAKAISDAFISFGEAVGVAIEALRKMLGILELLAAAWAAEKVLAFSKALLGVEIAAKAATVAQAELAAVQAASAGKAVALGAAQKAVAVETVAAGAAATAAAATTASASTTAAAAATAVGTAAAETGLKARAAAVGVRLLGVAMRTLTGLAVGAVVLGVIELASRFFQAKKAAEDADAAIAMTLAGPPAGQQTAKVAVHDVIAELADFKKNLPKLESDISALTGEGLANVAKSTIENLRAIKAEGIDMGKAILTISERAAQALGIELPSQAAKASTGFKGVRAEAELLIGQLPNLGLSAEKSAAVVSQALSKMVNAAATKADFDQVEQAIGRMAATGKIGIGAVTELMRQSKDRAKELKDQVEANTPGMQSLGEAAKKAGVDVGLLTNGITKGGKENIITVRDLVSEIINTKVSAEKAAPVLADAFDQRIKAAQTRNELVALIAEINRARGASLDFGGALGRALDDAKTKADQLNPVMAALRAEAKRLGVELAGVQGSKPSPSLTNPDGSQKGDNAPAANAGPRSNDIAFYSTTGSTREERLAGQNSVDASAQYNLLARARKGQITADDLPFAQTVLAALINNSRLEASVNPGAISLAGQASRREDYALAQRAVDLAAALQPIAQLATPGIVSGSPQSVGAAATASIAASQANTTRNLNISFNGSIPIGVSTASDADSARLEAMLRQLEAAASRAGA